MNYYNHNKLLIKKQTGYIIDLLFILSLFIAVIKLENYLYNTENYSFYPDLVNNELILSEQIAENSNLSDYNDYCGNITYHNFEASHLSLFKIAVYSYNCLVFIKFKTIISNHIIHLNIISILQKNNTWHKSPEDKPVIST